MKGIRPCPYCGGEVEVIRLADDKETGKRTYRIECRNCRKLVARGRKFKDETEAEGKERIKDYERVQAERFAIPEHSERFTQSRSAIMRDRKAAMMSRISMDDAQFEMHDANMRNKNRGGWR